MAVRTWWLEVKTEGRRCLVAGPEEEKRLAKKGSGKRESCRSEAWNRHEVIIPSHPSSAVCWCRLDDLPCFHCHESESLVHFVGGTDALILSSALLASEVPTKQAASNSSFPSLLLLWEEGHPMEVQAPIRLLGLAQPISCGFCWGKSWGKEEKKGGKRTVRDNGLPGGFRDDLPVRTCSIFSGRRPHPLSQCHKHWGKWAEASND